MKKSLNYIFLIIVFVLFGMHIVVKDKVFSDSENRTLAQFPTFSINSLIKGEFRNDFEEYVADQFPLRNIFVGIKSYCEKIIGKKENNGVYVGKNDFFIQKMNNYDKDLLDRNVSYINNLAEKYNVTVAVAPTSYTIMSEMLPLFVDKNIERNYIGNFYLGLSENINRIDLISPLRLYNNEYIYYKTDHHWTTLGAYYAYREVIEEFNMVPYEKDKFNIETVSEDFLGTLYSKGNFFYSKKDSMILFENKDDLDIEVDYVFEDEHSNSLYDYEALDTKDKYNVFLGGNFASVKITNNKVSDGKLVVFKDSYANSVVPFLVNHFNEILLIDLRHFNGDVREYLTENNVKDILILYNANGLSSDNNLYKLKERK